MNARVAVSAGPDGPRPSRVEDVGGGAVAVSWPSDASGSRLRGRPGDTVTLTWTSQWGVHEVRCTLVECRSDPVPQWLLRAVSAPPVRQRRDAFRLDVRLPLELRRVPPEEPRRPGGAEGPAVQGTTIDVSEGGLGFAIPAEAAGGVRVEPGEVVEATFPLDDGEVTLAGTIVRVGEPADGERSGGLRFDGVPDDVAARLRRFVMREQIRRRSLVGD